MLEENGSCFGWNIRLDYGGDGAEHNDDNARDNVIELEGKRCKLLLIVRDRSTARGDKRRGAGLYASKTVSLPGRLRKRG